MKVKRDKLKEYQGNTKENTGELSNMHNTSLSNPPKTKNYLTPGSIQSAKGYKQ